MIIRDAWMKTAALVGGWPFLLWIFARFVSESFAQKKKT